MKRTACSLHGARMKLSRPSAGSIPKGKKFEDVITSIMYTNGKVSGQINVAEEYKRFQSQQPSLVKSAGARLREYAPMTLTVYE